MYAEEFFDLEWMLEFLQLMVDGFSNVWGWLTTPIEKLLEEQGILGILAGLVVPDSIDAYSPIYFMCSIGIGFYIGFTLAKFIWGVIKSFLPAD